MILWFGNQLLFEDLLLICVEGLDGFKFLMDRWA